MQLIIKDKRIIAIALAAYVRTGIEDAIVDAPEGFTPADMDRYRYEDGKLYIPEESPAPSVPLTKLAFIDRFTDAELLAIREAAKTAPEVELWLWRFERAEDISLSDLRTIAGVQGLESAGLLAEGRAAEILA